MTSFIASKRIRSTPCFWLTILSGSRPENQIIMVKNNDLSKYMILHWSLLGSTNLHLQSQVLPLKTLWMHFLQTVVKQTAQPGFLHFQVFHLYCRAQNRWFAVVVAQSMNLEQLETFQILPHQWISELNLVPRKRTNVCFWKLVKIHTDKKDPVLNFGTMLLVAKHEVKGIEQERYSTKLLNQAVYALIVSCIKKNKHQLFPLL